MVFAGVRMMCRSKRENCPAFGKRCNKCNKQNHFANVCFGSVLMASQRGNRVHYLEDEFSDEVFGVEEISAVTLDDSQLVTLKLESGNYLSFSRTLERNVMWSLCICIRKRQETLICSM